MDHLERSDAPPLAELAHYSPDGYGGASVHRVMLADRARTETYRRALEALVGPASTVLDVGAGTGILSFFAAAAGARKVYAVDRSDLLLITRKLVEANGFADRIECIAGSAERLELPEQVDVLVSEWMGFFAISEAMFESVFEARDRHLAPGGAMSPSRIRLLVTPVESDCLYFEQGPGFWQRPVYGFDFTALFEHELVDLETRSVEGKDARPLAAPAVVVDVDCERDRAKDLWFDASLDLLIEQAGTWHGLLGHFEAELAPGVVLSTAADQPLTHWRQSWFPMRARDVQAGDRLRFRFRAQKDPRGDGGLPMYFTEGEHERGGATLARFFYCHHGIYD